MKSSTFLDEHLAPDEQLLWVGHPRDDFFFVPRDLLLIPAGMIATVIAGIIAWNFRDDGLIVLFAAPFAFAAVASFGRPVMDWYKRRNTQYAVTDQRIIVRTNTCLDRTLRTVQFSVNFQMTPVDVPGGTTTIYFGAFSSWDPYYPARHPFWSDLTYPPAFTFLKDAVPVMDLIITARRQQKPGR